MTQALMGTGVSKGIAIGNSRLLQRGNLEIDRRQIPQVDIKNEIIRFRFALSKAQHQLREIRNRIPQMTPVDIAEFIDAHLLMLEDATLSEGPIRLIQDFHCNAEWALKKQRDKLVAVFDEMDDPYLKTRKDDIDHVVNCIQRALIGDNIGPQKAANEKHKNEIIFADDLAPADTVIMAQQGIAAFVTEYGGPMSHTTILARSFGIPAVVSAYNVCELIRDNEQVIVDGNVGVIIVDADAKTTEYYKSQQQEEKKYRHTLQRFKHGPTKTKDGSLIDLQANIEFVDDIDAATHANANGIGLYRTEFMFMNRNSVPDEEEHLQTYLKVLRALKGKPLSIRTLDLGADKALKSHGITVPLASNPALGLRAIRLCLQDTSLFIPQLRAILRASAMGAVRLLIPMLTTVQELDQVLTIVQQIKAELKEQNLDFNQNIPIGGIIEVPAAALCASAFAKKLDFMSIGTNDLIQYAMAIDRIADEVSYLYDPLNSAVLQLIHMTINAAKMANIPVSMCGEMAGDCYYTRLLMGMGLAQFSMYPSALLEIKSIIAKSDLNIIKPIAQRILSSDNAEESKFLMEELNKGI